jgi:hypothetical protein
MPILGAGAQHCNPQRDLLQRNTPGGFSGHTVIYNSDSIVKKLRKKTFDATSAAKPKRPSRWAAPAAIAALVLIFYAVPLVSESASIQWDAADLHYPFQKYWSDHLRAASLPLWTPYIFSGYPFMAYPETAAWYPPHWPFFLAGITPRTIQAELALNAFLACLGAFLLISRLVESRAAAVLGGLCYGLSGFFAGHASHIGIFGAAACFPWLLLAFRRALDGTAVLYTVLGGIVGAAMILAGYFQTAMYGFLALGLYAAADLYHAPRRWFRIAWIVSGTLALAIILAAIQIVPTLELVRNTFRARSDYSRTAEGVLELRALPTLVAPDWLGAISSKYTGPPDITQYYFYAGFLLLPLVALGLAKTRSRTHALLLILPAAWFMFGGAAGLYRVAMLLPGMNKVREPIQGWFVVALGLAMLAAAGFAWLEQRWCVPYLGVIVIAILFVDVWYWNSLENPLAYGHFAFDRAYGDGESAMLRHVVPAVPPLTRFEGRRRAVVGPQDSALDLRLETTGGYAALPIRDYMRYLSVMKRNPKLRDGLNVSTYLTADSAGVESNPSVLPRFYFPKSITDAGSREEVLLTIETLDPQLQSVALTPHSPIRQDPAAMAAVLSYGEDSYRIRYHAASPSLLRLSLPYYPGWRATVEGKQLPIVHVDLALMGLVVPAGDHELQFSFRSDAFRIGVAISLAGVILCTLLVAASARSRRTAIKNG